MTHDQAAVGVTLSAVSAMIPETLLSFADKLLLGVVTALVTGVVYGLGKEIGSRLAKGKAK